MYHDIFHRSIAAMFGFVSDNGLIDAVEGVVDLRSLMGFSGFSYDAVPIRVLALTYSGFESVSGRDLPQFDRAPTAPADGKITVTYALRSLYPLTFSRITEWCNINCV